MTAADPPGVAERAGVVHGLDGLRAVAAVVVVAYHVQFLTGGESTSGVIAAAAGAGWVGVDLFFAISGFVLLLPFARAHAQGRSLDVRRFYARRARRILPAFWVNLFVLVTLVHTSLLASGPGLATVLTNATFTADYLGRPSVNSVYWSLYCEMAFYLVLPWLSRAFVGRRWMVGLPVAIAVGVGYRTVVVLAGGTDESHFRAIMQLPGVIDQFAYGMAAGACWVALERRGRVVPAWAARSLVVGGLALVGVVVVLVHGVIGLADFWSGRGGTAALAALRPLVSAGFAMVVVGACSRPGLLRSALELRPVRYLGLVSYGLYLWHLPLIKAFADGTGGVALSGVGYVVAVAAVLAVATVWATLSYRFVELPFLGTRRAQARSTTPDAPAAPTTPVAPAAPDAPTPPGIRPLGAHEEVR